MAKTLASIQQQIDKLQEQANSLKRKEAVGVIARIKTAIDAYGLTVEDLFGATAAPLDKARQSKVSDAVKPGKKRHMTGSKVAPVKKSAKPAKFSDGQNSWSGYGKRPNWYKAAIAEGKTPEDLTILPSQ
jgi:DNA-binding protein H-NS